MNPQEITAYLAASHIAVVATIHRNGHPHLTPNWYRYDGQVLTLITRKDRLKYRHLQRHNRICVCIYDPPAASNYVVISGTATCNDQDIWDEARRIIERYRRPDAAFLHVNHAGIAGIADVPRGPAAARARRAAPDGHLAPRAALKPPCCAGMRDAAASRDRCRFRSEGYAGPPSHSEQAEKLPYSSSPPNTDILHRSILSI